MTQSEQVLATGQVVRAGFWVFGIRIAQRFFSFARLIILAMFLAPYDFGLMGIALLTISSIETFTQTGFQQALVQRKGNIVPYLDTAWTFTVIRGAALFSITLLAAPLASSVFDASEATLIIRITALSILFQSFTSTAVIFFQKELDFRKQFAYNFSGVLVDFTVSIIAVFILRDVWALVFGLLAGHVVRMCMSYILHPYRPRLDLDFTKAKELFGFGKWILGSSVLVFLITQGDSILIGYVMGVVALGLYQLATVIANTPTTEIANVVGEVAFPAFAKLQDRIDILRAGYLRVLKITTFFAFGLTCFLIVLTDELIKAFMSYEWLPIVAPVQILAVAGSVRALAATTSPVFVALGKPRIGTTWQILRLAILFTLLYPLTVEWGVSGAAFAVLVSISVTSIGVCGSVIRLTGCGTRSFLRELIAPSLVAVSGGTVMFAANLAIVAHPIIELILVGLIGLLVILGATVIIDRLMGTGMMPLIRTILNPVLGKSAP